MPRFYILALIAVFLITSCAPQATALPPQLPTATALSTVTPSPTNTPTPTLEPWMVSLPEGVVSVTTENGTIYGVDSKGKQIMEFDIANSEWVEKEKVYTSGVDPELQEQVRAKAEAALGMSIKEYWAGLNVDKGVGINEIIGSYRNHEVWLGSEVVRLTAAGAHENDRSVIGFMSEFGNEDVMYPYVFCYTYNDVFYQTTGVKGRDGQSVTFGSVNELENYFDANFSTGDVFVVSIQSFGPHDRTYDEWRSITMDGKQSNLGMRTEAIIKLLELMNNGFMERMTGSSPRDLVNQLNASQGDIGLFAPLIVFAQ